MRYGGEEKQRVEKREENENLYREEKRRIYEKEDNYPYDEKRKEAEARGLQNTVLSQSWSLDSNRTERSWKSAHPVSLRREFSCSCKSLGSLPSLRIFEKCSL